MNQKPDFFTSFHCRSRVHCGACRRSQDFRASLRPHFTIPDLNFACPYGVVPDQGAARSKTPVAPAEQFVSAGKAVLRTARQWARGGQVLADPAQRRHRQATCAHCPALDRPRGRCRECGCFIEAKTSLAVEACPLGRWTAVMKAG